jgi:hypothetical protein
MALSGTGGLRRCHRHLPTRQAPQYIFSHIFFLPELPLALTNLLEGKRQRREMFKEGKENMNNKYKNKPTRQPTDQTAKPSKWNLPLTELGTDQSGTKNSYELDE